MGLQELRRRSHSAEKSSISRDLLEQDIITKAKYDDVMRTKDNFSENSNKHETTEKKELTDEKHFIDNDIKVLKEYLYKENKEKFVTRLKNVLIEACFVKLILTCPDQFKEDDSHIAEPTVLAVSK
nr:unnamed protein product [Callosobruchus analis]